jgi:hypothetical protein
MHQTVKCASVGSVGDLGHIASALGAAGFNIEAIGGGEATGVREDDRGVGVISLLVTSDEDADIPKLEETLNGIELDDGRKLANWQILPSLDVEFRHDRGELGEAAAALGAAGINIQSILLIDARGGRAIVSMAFDADVIDTARDILNDAGRRFRVLPKHGGKARRDQTGN